MEDEDTIITCGETLEGRIEQAGGTESSETLRIEDDGTLEVPKKVGDKSTSLFSQIGYESPEALMELALQIETRFPHLHFTFETDPEGSWLKYTVKKHVST